MVQVNEKRQCQRSVVCDGGATMSVLPENSLAFLRGAKHVVFPRDFLVLSQVKASVFFIFGVWLAARRARLFAGRHGRTRILLEGSVGHVRRHFGYLFNGKEKGLRGGTSVSVYSDLNKHIGFMLKCAAAQKI